MKAKLIVTLPETGKDHLVFDGEADISVTTIFGSGEGKGDATKLELTILPGSSINGLKFENNKLVGVVDPEG